MEESKQYSCKGCGTEEPKEALDDQQKTMYWFGALKGTRDFWQLMSNMRLKIMTVNTRDIPTHLLSVYDFYCIDCIFEEAERLAYERLKWEMF